MKKVYLASPLGFSEISSDFYYNKLIPLITDAGFEIIDPWSLSDKSEIDKIASMQYGIEKKHAWEEMNHKIARNNYEAVKSADIVVAVLDGADVDSGTASEIGFAFGLGKKIVGYRADIRMSGDNEGAVVNLQVEYFIRESGGDIVYNYKEIPELLARICRY